MNPGRPGQWSCFRVSTTQRKDTVDCAVLSASLATNPKCTASARRAQKMGMKEGDGRIAGQSYGSRRGGAIGETVLGSLGWIERADDGWQNWRKMRGRCWPVLFASVDRSSRCKRMRPSARHSPRRESDRDAYSAGGRASDVVKVPLFLSFSSLSSLKSSLCGRKGFHSQKRYERVDGKESHAASKGIRRLTRISSVRRGANGPLRQL